MRLKNIDVKLDFVSQKNHWTFKIPKFYGIDVKPWSLQKIDLKSNENHIFVINNLTELFCAMTNLAQYSVHLHM